MEHMLLKALLPAIATVCPSIIAAAGSAAADVEAIKTFPAKGEVINELRRVKIILTPGFGPVGYDKAADGVRVYIEDATGHRIPLVNTAGNHAMIDPEWNLEEYTGATNSKVHTYKDKLYNQLFTRTHGWNGGDGVLTVGLPGGHVYWTFNDSFYGVVDAETRARGGCSFPRNTIMAQRADEFSFPLTTDDDLLWMADFIQTEDPNKEGYYKALTHIDHPNAQDFNGDGIAQDYLYWSGDGSIVDNKLQMMWQGVDNRNGWMVGLSTALATYSLEGEPGDPDYLKIESIDHNFRPENNIGYGSTLWEDEDGHTYLYTSIDNGGWLGHDPIVARSATHDLTDEWEYYISDAKGNFSWQKRYPTEEEAKRSGIAPKQGSFTLPWVIKKGGHYYMFTQTYPFGTEMAALISDNPWGPFTDRKIMIRFPNPLDELQHDKYGDQYRFLYMLNIHPALSRDGELVISTNTDVPDSSEGAGDAFWRNFNNPGSADWYRPFFYRVYGWENLFNESLNGASDHIDFVPADGSVLTAPGMYHLICEEGVFGDEEFETSGFASGRTNRLMDIEFSIGTPTGIESPMDNIFSDADPIYYNMMGVRITAPTPGTPYIERRGNEVRKVIF